jgi:hypothetical protein
MCQNPFAALQQRFTKSPPVSQWDAVSLFSLTEMSTNVLFESSIGHNSCVTTAIFQNVILE